MNETLKSAIKQFGVPAQMEIVIEELAELTQAICKAKRAGIIKPFGIIRPYIESNPKEIEAFNNLVSETADVKNVIQYLDELLGIENIAREQERKIARLQEEIDKLKNK